MKGRNGHHKRTDPVLKLLAELSQNQESMREAAGQIGLLIEKSAEGRPESDYREILRPDLARIALDDGEVEFLSAILMLYFNRTDDPVFLWALGKAPSKIGLPLFRRHVLPRLKNFNRSQARQALVALENFVLDSTTASERHAIHDLLPSMVPRWTPTRKIARRILQAVE